MFRLILPETVPDLVAAESDAGDTRPMDADAAAARTRADYGRASRWGMGILGTAGGFLALLLASFAVSVATSGLDPFGDALFAGFVLLVAAGVGGPAVWLLVALHRSGRRLARAAAYWAALPYRQGRRTPTRGDWFAVRFLGFSSDLFPRLLTSGLCGLGTVFAVSLFVRTLVDGRPAGEGFLWLSSAVLFASVCAGQFGGVQRLQNAFAARERVRRP